MEKKGMPEVHNDNRPRAVSNKWTWATVSHYQSKTNKITFLHLSNWQPFYCDCKYHFAYLWPEYLTEHLKGRNCFCGLRFQKCQSIRAGKAWWKEQSKYRCVKKPGGYADSQEMSPATYFLQPTPTSHFPPSPSNATTLWVHQGTNPSTNPWDPSLETPSQTQPEVCFSGLLSSSQPSQPDHQHKPLFIMMVPRAVKSVAKLMLSLVAT